MPRMIFLNLPVRDLAAAVRFYEAIGCTKNEEYSDDSAASMMWSDEIVFHLLTRERFASFTSQPVGDPQKECSLMVALSCDSREEVDELVRAAAKGGGRTDLREAQDHGFMYTHAFADPDGHVLEPVWMNPAAV